jgi:hypothetical protein
MTDQRSVRLDLRAILPVAALAVVVLVIIFVELCGRQDVKPFAQTTPFPTVPQATPAATFTPGPSPTGGVSTTATPPAVLPGGEQRDTQRAQDLAALQAALVQYHDKHGKYPSANGNVQTLCAFPESDAGCKLKDDGELDPLPIDPKGEPITENGYWFRSTDNDYAIFAQRESDAVPECDEHPDFLKQFKSLICVTSPPPAP